MTEFPPFRAMTTDSRPEPISPFDRALRAVLDDLFVVLPTFATVVGFHDVDDRWPDLTAGGRRARLELYARHRTALEGLSDLSEDEFVDRGIVVQALDAFAFDDEVLDEGAWDALSYVRIAGDGLHELLAREYAPWSHRGWAFAWRARRLPTLLGAARDRLAASADRPVSRLHAETALAQLGGIATLVEEAIVEAERQSGPDARDIERALREVAGEVAEAVDAFRGFVETEVLPAAEGEGRLGGALFGAKLRHALESDLSLEELKDRATRDFAAVRARLVEVARGAWPRARSGEPVPGEDDAVVRGIWDVAAGEHPSAEGLLDFCRAATTRIEDFVRERGLMRLPGEPLRITWTPEFLRPYGGAFLSPPGPLDRGLVSEFWVTPPDPDWPADVLESYLREQCTRNLEELCIHEAIPGHYLQLSASNGCSSLARAVFQSGIFAEGWACYISAVMLAEGYGGSDPLLEFCELRLLLREIGNAILDVGIHVEGMDESAAMALMVEGAFQEPAEATRKYLRARLTSTQLSTYYVGDLGMRDVEAEARRKAAVLVGIPYDGEGFAGVLERPGDTPGFGLAEHLESVVAHGTPPIPWLRRLLLGPADAAS